MEKEDGIVIQAATPSVFPLLKGHGSNIFRDGLRLVLITFLVSSALWAQIDFIGLILDPASTSGCQVVVIFNSVFDQLARFAIEQFLLWTINANASAPAGTLAYQAVLGVRFVLGGVFVGFQKAQLATVCVARNNLLAIGAVVMAIDFVIVVMLVFRVSSIDIKSIQSKKAVMWTIGGLGLWTATSVPLLLGIDTIELLFRTALPAVGLSILLSILTSNFGALLLARQKQAVHPDAQSPRNITSSRDLSTSDTDYPPSRYEDLKAGAMTTVTTFNQPRDFMAGADGALPIIAASAPGQANIGVGGVPVQGQLFPPTRSQTAPVRESRRIDVKPNILNKRSIFDRAGPGSNMRNAISNPILQETGEQNPLSKIATIDLATAARNDRERRGNGLTMNRNSSTFNAHRPAPKPPAITPDEALKRAQSGKRKEVGFVSPPEEPPQLRSAGLMSHPPATTSSAQLSPGVEEIRRRSPRQLPEDHEQDQETRSATPPQPIPVPNNSQPRPTQPEQPLSSFETVGRSASQRTAETSLSQNTLDRSASQKSTVSSVQATSHPKALVPPPKSPARLTSPKKKPDLPPTWPIQTVVNPTIRPSRQKPPSPKTPPAAPLQRRPTGGLPSNPRAMTMRPVAKEPPAPQEQTVMFVNNIQYNDPTAVQNIIQGATNQAAKTPLSSHSPAPALKSSNSVVHRPRPIPRQQGKDRPIFPAENSPNHKRSKSGGSIMSRRSILMSDPGSPTQLPPLPPPPKSAGGQPVRALPNDTKSMTFDEKMNLFFPVALGSSTDANGQHRTSIPEMPLVPSAYMRTGDSATEEKGVWDSESNHDQSKRSDRSTKTSVRTRSILGMEEEEEAVPDLPPRFTSKFSVDTSVITGRPDENEYWISVLPANDSIGAKPSYDGAKRQSSPVIPVRNPSLSEFSEARTARTRDEETTTNWGSIHSPVAAVNIQDVTHMPKPTWIQPRDERNPRDLSMISQNDGKEVMTIMLDASIEHEIDLDEAPSARQSPAHLPDANVADQRARWHRRIGDESITFTERKEKIQSRRQPPPMPLQLRSPVKKMAIVMHTAEPSPLESPQHAYEVIQAQLKKLEEPNRDSYESEGQRIRLLESLEAEMGQQESQWHEMQHGLSRNSLSTVGTNSVRNSQSESLMTNSPAVPSIDVPQVIPQRNDISLDRQAARRARTGASKSSNEDLRSASSISSQSQSNSSDNRTSLWQQRLADAQSEYMENASELLAKRNLNFLSVSKVPLSARALQLGSPTPPDTDESDPDDAQILARLMPNERATPPEGLWSPDSPVYFEREQPSLLWAPAHHHVATKSSVPSGDGYALPGLSVRPATRKVSEPLNISSSRLWQPDHTAAKKLRTASGLWRPSWVPEPPKPQTRPVTQRPPRRNKRVTLLPDILESPQPLPDKRGTLGIFQFPWGEKSDTATITPQPSHMLMAMPGTMSTGGSAIRAALEARAKQLESAEYSSSFFDDYDEEEEGDDEISDIEQDNDSDDGFDETTLWEIASLLQSDQVPSKNSLLPQQAYYRPDSLIDEHTSPRSHSEYEDSEEETIADEETKHDSMVITIAAEVMPAAPEPVSLWAPRPKSFITTRKATGLPQPDARTWGGYIEKLEAVPRVREYVQEPATIYSTALWMPPVKQAALKTTSLMWTKPQQQPAKTLWAAQPAPTHSRKVTGLPQPDARTWGGYIEKLEAVPRVRECVQEPATIYSTALWTLPVKQTALKTTGPMWTKPQQQPAKTLWAAQPAPTHSRKVTGLPQPDAYTWQGYVEKLEATPRVREHVLEPAIIYSTALWTPPVKQTALKTTGLMWTKPQQRATRTLWVAPPAIVYTDSTGLFNISHKRVCFRTTSAEPVGLGMPSGARVISEELPQLMSTSLWTLTPVSTRVENWMSFSTARPGSPLEMTSSGRSTPSLDTASTRSDDEEVVSDFEPLPDVPVKKTAWWDSVKTKLSPPAQAGPQPERLRRTKATPAEWEAALNEAIRAISSPRLVRIESTPAQWVSALNQAIAASLNPAKSHPAFAGSVQRTGICDPAVANPIFFSLSLATIEEPSLMPEELTNPASLSHDVPLWSAPAVKIPENTSTMWIPPTKPRLHAHDTSPMKAEDPEARRLRIRRAKTDVSALPPLELVSFNGQLMWNRFYGAELRRVAPRGNGLNWLESAVKPSVSKVVFRY
ncbi:hypothetical protein LZ32DRAFT_659019 [Colletotrichum eremochloae]|nr:hypothetical protein LZ32DRAFT_659019 [Colletotrichum eremochloae]